MAKRQQKRRPAETPSRRRTLSGLAALVGASGLLATVTGLVVSRSFDPVADRTADVVGSSPLVVYYDADDDLDPVPGAAFALDHLLPATALTGPADSRAVSARLVREGGVRVDQTSSAMTVENSRREKVVITSIKAEVRKRTAAPSAALIVVGASGGSGEGPIELHFDLDAVDVDARTVDKQGRLGGEYLDEHGVTLEPEEKLRFNLVGHAAADLVDWVVKVHYVVNGKSHVLELAPHGRPMRVTGVNATYREAFTWHAANGLIREPLKKLCPRDCRKKIVPAGFK